jgi:hypothetical protein
VLVKNFSEPSPVKIFFSLEKESKICFLSCGTEIHFSIKTILDDYSNFKKVNTSFKNVWRTWGPHDFLPRRHGDLMIFCPVGLANFKNSVITWATTIFLFLIWGAWDFHCARKKFLRTFPSQNIFFS